MKVVVLGTRGIPHVMGGVETHCENLYPRLVDMGCDVTIITRRGYGDARVSEFNGVKLLALYAPRNKSLEALVHTFLGVITAFFLKPDILHIHAIGPSLLTPLAKLLRMKVVITHHGQDYLRLKWGGFAKAVLRLGERVGIAYADQVIVITVLLKNVLTKHYRRTDLNIIPNGVSLPNDLVTDYFLPNYGLERKKYIVCVGRFVEEKGFHDLIAAYSALKNDVHGFKLVLVGDEDHASPYGIALKASAIQEGVILTGFLTGEHLMQLFANAALFVIPSYHEAHQIALLEAMSFKLPIVASDIPAHLAFNLGTDSYFPVGAIDSLKFRIAESLRGDCNRDYSALLKQFDWALIAKMTYDVYLKAYRGGTLCKTKKKPDYAT